jgi:uncharacterized protein YegL
MDSESSRSVPLYYSDIEADSNAQRQPLVLCLDTSSSMAGAPIAALNEALRTWTQELRTDVNLSNSVELALITFGGNQVATWQGARPLPYGTDSGAFVPAHAFSPPVLAATGVTLMTEALETAMRLVAVRKSELRGAGLLYYRPQICLVTDGQPTDVTGHPTDDWHRVVPLLTREQEAKKFRLFAIGVGGMTHQGEQVLQAVAPKYNARLQGFPFRGVLQMMSASAGAQQKGDGEEVFEKIFARFKTQRSAWDM